MTQVNNLIGETFGRLTVVSRSDNNHKGRAKWLCLCSCGTEKVILGDHLTRRDGKGVLSCGCLQQENRTKHGAYLPNADIRYHIKHTLLQALRDRARRRGYQSDLELGDMPETPLQLYRKWDTGLGKGKGRNRHDTSPTIDRIKSNLPYLKKYKDNLFVISWRANKLKSDGALSEFEGIVDYMRNRGVVNQRESSLMDSKPIISSGGNEAQATVVAA
jgi:hypothetical protein